MTKQEILTLLKEARANGFTYKGIAKQIDARPEDIYTYIHRAGPLPVIHEKLEKFFQAK